MSPSESDLRRALQHGEDNHAGIDVQSIMAAGERRRAQRRARLGTGLVAAALVVGVAGGGLLLAGGRSDDKSSGDAAGGMAGVAPDARSAPGKAAQGSADSRGSAAGSSAASSAGGTGCPSELPRLALPGGGGTGQFGAGGRLFAKPVASVLVCAFDTGGTRRTGQVVLRETNSDRLVTSLEAASTKDAPCPAILELPRPNYAILATATDGTRLRVVTVSIGRPACQNVVTDGTAVRYSYQPPSGLDGILARLAGSAPSSPGRVQGSPARS